MDRRSSSLLALALLAVLVWTTMSAENPATPQSPRTTASRDSLGGGDRYLTYVSTDKPIYRPGESLFVRAVPLHYITRKPIAAAQALPTTVEIKGPKGDTVAAGIAQLQECVYGFSWAIPPSQAGGEYTIKVSNPYTGQPPAERTFDIRAYRAPRLKTQIKFIRDGYGAGDEVVASLHAERAEGGVPGGAAVVVIARVDGAETFRGPARIDGQGNCLARFKLPTEIRRGEGTLAMVIEDGGAVETASKTIPILLQTVDLAMYPEGGELVAGLVNRVYFEAFTPARKPADLAGVVLDADGREIAAFRSQHEGRGRFTLTPAAGGKYTLKITQPSGIKTQYELPPVKPSGAVLTALQEITAKGEDVRVSLGATAAGFYRVAIQQREQEIAVQQVELPAGGSKVLAFSAGPADGVLRVTVWNAAGQPLAERLVFRQPTHSVRVQLSADAKQYVPGGRASITVRTSDETGQPVSAVVGITATDDSILEMIDKREQAPRLPAMVLLEGEVKELADAHVYLDPANSQAPAAVDLLLGTQGWRRFAFIEPAKFAAAGGDMARRVLALKEAPRPIAANLCRPRKVPLAVCRLLPPAPPLLPGDWEKSRSRRRNDQPPHRRNRRTKSPRKKRTKRPRLRMNKRKWRRRPRPRQILTGGWEVFKKRPMTWTLPTTLKREKSRWILGAAETAGLELCGARGWFATTLYRCGSTPIRSARTVSPATGPTLPRRSSGVPASELTSAVRRPWSSA